jgi:predicted Zn-dependent peptidase
MSQTLDDAAQVIERTEVDGVPVFWSEVPGPRVGSLMFRVGRADEPAPKLGITHLVEHLALAPLTQQPYDHNGFVASIRTVFHARGTDDELVAYMASVCASLRALPTERILMERRILIQEANNRSSGSSGMSRWYRYGHTTFGLLGAYEIGLSWLGPEPVQAWADEWFTRENAAVWWSGRPPDTLRLDLAPGRRRPPPEARLVAGVSLPSRTDAGGNGVSAGFLARRSAATRITQITLERRVRQDLRFERGLIYDVGSDYDAVSATDAHAMIGMDCQRDDATTVASAVIGVLDSLAASGATAEEITREADDFAEGASEAGGRMGFLDATAHDHLLGRERETPATVVAEYRSVTPADTSAAAQHALETLLLHAPPGPYDERMTPYPIHSPAAVTGRTLRPTGWLVGPKARKDRLVVGPDGVTWVGPTGLPNTVRYDECVAVRHWEGPIRELWGADGFRVVVSPHEFRGTERAIQEIDAALAPELVACDEHGIGALEAPKDPPAQTGEATDPG